MKYLSNYIEDAQTKLFESKGAFFAFSKKQFDEQKKEGVDYVSLFAGLICPKENAKSLLRELDAIVKSGIEQDLKENGKKNIIWRELANHEAQITCSIDDTIAKLADYPITEAEIKAEFSAFMDHCIENNLF